MISDHIAINKMQKGAIKNLLFHCGNLQRIDNALILCDGSTRSLADAFAFVAAEENYSVNVLEIPPLNRHGMEPPGYALQAMRTATLILSLCQYSLAHSSARIEASKSGARFLSLPLYHWQLLQDPCLHIDFKSQAPLVRKFADAFTHGHVIHITTAAVLILKWILLIE